MLYTMSNFFADNAGSRLIHCAEFGGGAVVETQRTNIEVVVSPFVGDGAERPGQVCGFCHHGGIYAYAADGNDECRNIQRFGNAIFQLQSVRQL